MTAASQANSAPRDLRSYLTSAMNKFASGDRSGAIQECTDAITRAPNFVAAYDTRGMLYKMAGNVERAQEDCNHILQNYPAYEKIAVVRARMNALALPAPAGSHVQQQQQRQAAGQGQAVTR